MANIFVFGSVATEGAPANHRTLNLAHISFFYLSHTVSSWIIYQSEITVYKQIQNIFFSMVVGPKLGLKLSLKVKSN